MIKFYYLYLKVFRHFLCYHNIDNMDNEKMPKNAEKYYCEICDYTCFNNNEYNKHLFTGKHQAIILWLRLLLFEQPLLPHIQH